MERKTPTVTQMLLHKKREAWPKENVYWQTVPPWDCFN